MKKFIALILFSITSNIFAQTITPFNSESGSKMLISSLSHKYAQQFLSEIKYFNYQENIFFCSVATTTIILNTLNVKPPSDPNFGTHPMFSPHNLFTANVISKTGISESSIWGHGLNLAKETLLLNAFDGVKATAYSDGNINEAEAKKIILAALKSDNQLVIANILRSKMDESGGGHFSPISAYDPKTDNVLFMDVASFRPYGLTWVPFNSLYNGMHTKDGNAYRGFIIVSKTK